MPQNAKSVLTIYGSNPVPGATTYCALCSSGGPSPRATETAVCSAGTAACSFDDGGRGGTAKAPAACSPVAGACSEARSALARSWKIGSQSRLPCSDRSSSERASSRRCKRHSSNARSTCADDDCGQRCVSSVARASGSREGSEEWNWRTQSVTCAARGALGAGRAGRAPVVSGVCAEAGVWQPVTVRTEAASAARRSEASITRRSST